jgi:hypothetical protein
VVPVETIRVSFLVVLIKAHRHRPSRTTGAAGKWHDAAALQSRGRRRAPFAENTAEKQRISPYRIVHRKRPTGSRGNIVSPVLATSVCSCIRKK